MNSYVEVLTKRFTAGGRAFYSTIYQPKMQKAIRQRFADEDGLLISITIPQHPSMHLVFLQEIHVHYSTSTHICQESLLKRVCNID